MTAPCTLTYPHDQVDNPAFSIIFPHKRTPVNDQCLKIALHAIKKNTTNKYELIIVEDPPGGKIDPYEAWNVAIPQAKSDHIIFSNTDVILAPGWDLPLVKYFDEKTIITQYLIECGAIGVHLNNIQRDFGKTPAAFRMHEFEDFTRTNPHAPCMTHVKEERKARQNHMAWDCACYTKRIKGKLREVPEAILEWPGNFGWYMPSYMHRKLFQRAGGFKTDVPFMYRPNDAILFEDCEKLGARIIRVRSYAYHFQNLSHRS
jgi:hypothetical protein